MSAKRENGLGETSFEILRACGAFAGGSPAVPANRLTLAGFLAKPLVVVFLTAPCTTIIRGCSLRFAFIRII